MDVSFVDGRALVSEIDALVMTPFVAVGFALIG